MLHPLVLFSAIFTFLIMGCYFIGSRRTMVRAARDGVPVASAADAAPYGRYFVVAVCAPVFWFCLAWVAFHTPYLEYRAIRDVPEGYWKAAATNLNEFINNINGLMESGLAEEVQKTRPDEVLLRAASDYSIYSRYLSYLLWIGASAITLIAYAIARRNLRPAFDAKTASHQALRRYMLLAAPIAAYMFITSDKLWNLW